MKSGHALFSASVVAVVALLSGCSSSGDDSTSASETTGPVTAQRYSTVEQLRDAAIDAGLPCPGWRQRNQVVAAAESGECSKLSVLSTYATDSDLQQGIDNWKSISRLARKYDLPVDPILIGPNWIINAPESPDLAETLGGTIQRMSYTGSKYQTPAATRQNYQTFAGDIFSVVLLDARSKAAKVRFCATAPYQGSSIPVSRSPWSLQDQRGTLWPADGGEGGLPGRAYPVDATVSVGDCLQGWIRFDAPSSITPVRVVYDSDIGGPFSWDLTATGSSVPPPLPSESPTYLDAQRDCYTLESAASPFPGEWLTLETRGQFIAEALQVQDRLNWLGYGCIPEDGDYGPVTQEAVMRFQRDFGLVVDGKVGPQTWATLFTYY